MKKSVLLLFLLSFNIFGMKQRFLPDKKTALLNETFTQWCGVAATSTNALQSFFVNDQQEYKKHWWYQAYVFYNKNQTVNSVYFDAKGDQLAVGVARELQNEGIIDFIKDTSTFGITYIYDVAKQKVVFKKKHNYKVHSVCFDPSDRYLAIGSSDVNVYDLTNNSDCQTYNHKRDISCLSFDSTGKRLVAGIYNGEISIIDIDQQKQIDSLRSIGSTPLSIQFHPNNQDLIYNDIADGMYIVNINSKITNTLYKTCTVPYARSGFDVSSCGNYIFIGRQCSLKKQNLIHQDEIELLKHRKSINAVRCDSQGQYVVIGEYSNKGHLCFIDLATQQIVKKIYLPYIKSLDFCLQGDRLAVGTVFYGAQIFDRIKTCSLGQYILYKLMRAWFDVVKDKKTAEKIKSLIKKNKYHKVTFVLLSSIAASLQCTPKALQDIWDKFPDQFKVWLGKCIFYKMLRNQEAMKNTKQIY